MLEESKMDKKSINRSSQLQSRVSAADGKKNTGECFYVQKMKVVSLELNWLIILSYVMLSGDLFLFVCTQNWLISLCQEAIRNERVLAVLLRMNLIGRMYQLRGVGVKLTDDRALARPLAALWVERRSPGMKLSNCKLISYIVSAVWCS